jgi:hypothetical protein
LTRLDPAIHHSEQQIFSMDARGPGRARRLEDYERCHASRIDLPRMLI